MSYRPLGPTLHAEHRVRVGVLFPGRVGHPQRVEGLGVTGGEVGRIEVDVLGRGERAGQPVGGEGVRRGGKDRALGPLVELENAPQVRQRYLGVGLEALIEYLLGLFEDATLTVDGPQEPHHRLVAKCGRMEQCGDEDPGLGAEVGRVLAVALLGDVGHRLAQSNR